MRKLARIALGATILALVAVAPPAGADSIHELENARAKDRAGRWLSDRDIELLDRYGDNYGTRPYYHGYYEFYAPLTPPPPRRHWRKRYWRED